MFSNDRHDKKVALVKAELERVDKELEALQQQRAELLIFLRLDAQYERLAGADTTVADAVLLNFTGGNGGNRGKSKEKAPVQGTGKKARMTGEENRGKSGKRHRGAHNAHGSRTKGRRA